MSQGSDPVIGQQLPCRGACDVTGGSGFLEVGKDTQLMQVLMIPLVAEPVIRREAEVYCIAAVDVNCGSGAVEVGMETLLVQLLVMSQGCE